MEKIWMHYTIIHRYELTNNRNKSIYDLFCNLRQSLLHQLVRMENLENYQYCWLTDRLFYSGLTSSSWIFSQYKDFVAKIDKFYCSLKAYGMALDDINLSFRLGYPDDLAYKLYDRKAKCLVAFKQMADAGEAYKLALKYVDKVSKTTAFLQTMILGSYLKTCSIIGRKN